MCCLLSCLCGKLFLFIFLMVLLAIGCALSYVVYTSAVKFDIQNLNTNSAFTSGWSDGNTYKALSYIFVPMFDIKTSSNCMLHKTETSSTECYQMKSGDITTTNPLQLKISGVSKVLANSSEVKYAKDLSLGLGIGFVVLAFIFLILTLWNCFKCCCRQGANIHSVDRQDRRIIV